MLSKQLGSTPSRLLLLQESPVFKLLNHGRRSLSGAELIAAIIGGRNYSANLDKATRILSHCQFNLHTLANMPTFEMQSVSGFSSAQCAQIIAAIEIGRRHQAEEVPEKVTVRSSADAFDYIRHQLVDLDREEFWVIFLNRGNRIMTAKQHSIGGLTGTVVDVKILIREAIQMLASGIILAHNHPSGNLQPSDADISVTRKLKEAAKLFEITILDHMIVADRSYYSFADNGIL